MSTPPTAPGRVPNAKLRPPRAFRGPVPMAWLTSAARLPGKSLHVGIALWHAASHQRSHQVALSNIDASRYGLNRNAKYRALQWLESAGLISVKRKLGRPPIVTVLEVGGTYDRKP